MWCFAIVNGRLAEIYFDGKGKKLVMRGHCYVKASEFKTAREQKHIWEDTAKYRLSFRNKWYRDMETGERIPLKPFKINLSEKTYTLEEMFPSLYKKNGAAKVLKSTKPPKWTKEEREWLDAPPVGREVV